MFQSITLVGSLGKDPSMRYTPSGVPVASFSLAVNRPQKQEDGSYKDIAIWFNVTAWRKQAETVSQYLTKGSKVLIVGEMEEARPFTDKSGNNRASLEVTAHTIKFLSSKNGNGDTAAATSEQGATDDNGVPW